MDEKGNSKYVYSDLEQLVKEAGSRDGEYALSINGNILELKFHPNNSDNLLVVFTAAVTRTNKKNDLPRFSGMGAVGLVNANILMISDPSLKLSDDLKIGWFAGNENFTLQSELRKVLSTFSFQFGSSRTILFGGSCGGFAATYYSANIPNSYAVVVNPQTDISKYHLKLVRKYISDCFPYITQHNEVVQSLRDTRIDYEVCSSFGQSQNKLIYIQNKEDRHHVDNHLQPFLEINQYESNKGDDIVRNYDNRFTLIQGDHWGKGHTAPTKEFMYGVISLLAEGVEHNTNKFHEEVNKLYRDSANYIYDCKLGIDDGHFISSIKLTKDLNPRDFEFTWRLYKNKECVEKMEYIDSNKIRFKFHVEEGLYWVIGFARTKERKDIKYQLRSNKIGI